MRRRELLENAKYTFTLGSYSSDVATSGGSITITVNSKKTLNGTTTNQPFTVSSTNGKITSTTVSSTYNSITIKFSANTSTTTSATSTCQLKQTDSDNTLTITLKQDKSSRGIIDGHEYVNFGLSVKWAKCNVGATSETQYGNYYKYGKGASTYQVTSGESYYSGIESPLAFSADTARQVMGGSWRMPTQAELQALAAQTTFTWETNFNGSGINGMKFTSKTNPNAYVFFPAAGLYSSGSLNSKGSYGHVWSSSPSSLATAKRMIFNGVNNIKVEISDLNRNYGMSVRGVHA